MSAPAAQSVDAQHALVAVVCSVPIVAEAVGATLADLAEVRTFPARRGDTAGLLRWLSPDAVVVDTADEAEAVTGFARETGVPLVEVSLNDGVLRVLRDGEWSVVSPAGDSPEALRNVLVAGIFGKGGRR